MDAIKQQAGSIVSEVKPSAKTAQQRRSELASLIGAKKDQAIYAMPQAVKDLVATLEGSEISIDGTVVRTVPMAMMWRQYQTKNGSTNWTCLDGFSGEKLLSKDGLTVSLKVSMTVFPSK